MPDNQFNKDKLLKLSNVKTHFKTEDGIVKAVDGVNFELDSGKTLGIVGESGCGKSVTARSIMRLLPNNKVETEGEILLNTDDKKINLAELDTKGKAIRNIRGKEISMIFQEPMTSLSPLHTINNQIVETILLHRDYTKKEARELAIEMLELVGIPDPGTRIDDYPYQLSGGMRQRAMIAMALSCNPSLLIADEPTTALDVTIQAKILELMNDLQEEYNMAIIMITHDLGVIAEVADEVVVMYLGKSVERGTLEQIFNNPQHPYTKGLLESIPKIEAGEIGKLNPIKGSVPSPKVEIKGCKFASRCSEKIAKCEQKQPEIIEVEEGHLVRCFRV